MSVPVITVAQMRQWEQASWDAGRSQAQVIATAGEAVARAAWDLTRSRDSILILAGKGHNGDDARAAGQHLRRRSVELLNVRDPAADLSSLKAALARRPDLVIDGLFGIGLNRPLSDAWISFLDTVNQTGLTILAVDVPSGLNADTGEAQPSALTATATLTLGAPKRGLLTPNAYPFTGRLMVATNIGLVPCTYSEELRWVAQEDFVNYPPAREVDGHKGTYGHVAVFAGSKGYHGAAVLAARGALRAQPGLVSVFCDEQVYMPVASQSQAAMVHPFETSVSLPRSCSALVIGPGLAAPGQPAPWQGFLKDQWRNAEFPVLVDASALDWIPREAPAVAAPRIITPHPGEASWLLGTSSSSVQENRAAALRALSSRFGGCWVILKGHQTLVGRRDGEIFVNSTGNPHLAQGGAGDTLAGFLGGLIAQKPLADDISQALRYGVWKHGQNADQLSARHSNWTIEELVTVLGS